MDGIIENIKIKHKPLSRQDLANPNGSMSYHERLVKSKAIDLRDNSYFVDFGNGYGIFEPIDKTKVVK